ncbi:hypothetical protein J6590_096458 [Homalodisca vitripennis]|nr:hypothetical protein J6590_096458 [Homalodisca vitripennis]
MNTGFQELCAVIDDFKFDILGLSETWLTPDVSSDCFIVDGYSLWRKDRQGAEGLPGAAGGGVALLVANHLLHDSDVSAARTLYCKARNKLNCAIRRAKRNYFHDKLNCKDSKSFWGVLRSGGVLENDRNSDDIRFSADDLNRYFAGMGGGSGISLEKLNFYRNNVCEDLAHGLNFVPVTEGEIKCIMNNITSVAVGTDGISIRLVKAMSPYCLGANSIWLTCPLLLGVFHHAGSKVLSRPYPK